MVRIPWAAATWTPGRFRFSPVMASLITNCCNFTRLRSKSLVLMSASNFAARTKSTSKLLASATANPCTVRRFFLKSTLALFTSTVAPFARSKPFRRAAVRIGGL